MPLTLKEKLTAAKKTLQDGSVSSGGSVPAVAAVPAEERERGR